MEPTILNKLNNFIKEIDYIKSLKYDSLKVDKWFKKLNSFLKLNNFDETYTDITYQRIAEKSDGMDDIRKLVDKDSYYQENFVRNMGLIKNTLEVLYDEQKEKIVSQKKESRGNWKKQTNLKNDTSKPHKNKGFLSFYFDKLKDILLGEDKFLRNNIHYIHLKDTQHICVVRN
ncbi:hypothetical protein COY26_04610 [Candidatus Woesearchaeota archaeon CG_4_10_14_0_2_um_filter_33_10]|nr:MAG: hypothetical protein COS79_03640 [Candidatus Woesearchaeota archaeon CG06_land_8_20_14_3_00_33_13]PIZ52401.1 MAG: hypothetical protein COY26_04610 [Candidatus Woesearchaeota archaeon CG_4_10_14_0_2_um_filter_33_10]